MNKFLGCSCCSDDGVEPGLPDDNWTTYCTDNYSAVEEEARTDNVQLNFEGFKS